MGGHFTRLHHQKEGRIRLGPSLNSCCSAGEGESGPTIDDLPDLALISILSHLTFAERLSAKLVCRRWCHLARNRMSWVNYYVLKNSDLQLIANSKPIKDFKLKKLIALFGKHIRELQFIKLHYTQKNGRECSETLYIEHLPQMLPHMPNVRHVVIDIHSAQDNMASLMGILPRLKSVHLIWNRCNPIENVDWLVQLVGKCIFLEYFYVDYIPDGFVDSLIKSGVKFPASLKHVTFGLYVNRADMEILTKMIINQCPKLDGFEGRLCDLQENTAKGLGNLKYLKEYCFCAVESRHSILRFGHWEDLRALHFHWMDSGLLKIITENCPNVEHLGIEQCWGTINNKSMTHSAERKDVIFPRLKSFMLRDYTAIEGFFPLLTRGTLQYIYLSSQLAIDQICGIVWSNPNLNELYVDQAFFANDIEEIYYKFIDYLPATSEQNLHIFCRGYGTDAPRDFLRENLHWFHICKNDRGNLDKVRMPVLDHIRFSEFSELPSEYSL